MEESDKGKLYIIAALIFIIWVVWTNFNIKTTNIKNENTKIPFEFKQNKCC